jgi:hypothetical protein
LPETKANESKRQAKRKQLEAVLVGGTVHQHATLEDILVISIGYIFIQVYYYLPNISREFLLLFHYVSFMKRRSHLVARY